jgi:osmotically-inducible protein OsmY
LQIRPQARFSDDEIAERLRQRLASHTAMNQGDVNVSVADGLAVLRGQVPTPRKRFAALRTAEHIDGISQVIDRLTVKQNVPGHEDATIEANIRSHLQWSPFVSGGVAVAVEQGVATLRGQLGSVTERRVALLIAYEGGAKEVVDELAIVAEEEPRRSES